jgi:hypothetical protein
MNRRTLRLVLLCDAVVLGVFGFVLMVVANHESNHEAFLGALGCSAVAGFLAFIEWIIRWTPDKTKEAEE